MSSGVHNSRRWPPEPGLITCLLICFTALTPIPSRAQNPAPRDLTQASLEDLLNIQVVSISKRPESLLKAGAAIFVITPEDIDRSTARTIPDLLRLVPGVDVAQIDASHVAVSIRGFNSSFSNKVLLLIDGRSLYSNVFSGVFWDEVDVPFENIERIEVIRGSGGTLWGANAVNGVINIITRPASATKGGLITAGTGNRDAAEDFAQFGGDAGPKGDWRAFAKYGDTRKSVFSRGIGAADGWHDLHAGFRSDWNLAPRDTLMVEGDLQTLHESGTNTAIFPGSPPYQSTVGQDINDVSGNILARWEHSLDSGSRTTLQTSYSAVRRNGQLGANDDNQTVDTEFTWDVAPRGLNHVIWGLGYRAVFDTVRSFASYAPVFIPPGRTDNLFSAFAEDEIPISRALVLTLGSKIEHNSYTGIELEPSAQLVWSVSERSALWGSVSRAARQPSRSDSDVQYNLSVTQIGPVPALFTLSGNPKIKAEHLIDYEAGYRSRIGNRVSFDIAAFMSYYHDLQTIEALPALPGAGVPWIVVPLHFENLGNARTYGVEVSANWNVTSRWELRPGYSLLKMAVHRSPLSGDPLIEQTPGNSPEHQAQISSLFRIRRNLTWDSSLMRVSALTNLNVPGYTRIDSRLGWKLGETMELSLVGQNLLAPRHREFLDLSGAYTATQVLRSVFVKLSWRF